MTRIFVICLVLFPLIFVGVLATTGTLQDLMPVMKEEMSGLFARTEEPPEPATPTGYDVIDALVVADVEARERKVAASLDSLQALQGRIETERRELSRLGDEVQGLVSKLQALEASLDAERGKERRAYAKVFSQMEPQRAAEILTYLEPDNVEFLIKSMQGRQAAEVLAMLEPHVAAQLSERILKPMDGTGAEESP